MRVLVISDTHGRSRNLDQILEMEEPFDALIHCGDVEGEEDYIEVVAECPAYIVAGNNDFFSQLPREIEEDLGGHRIFVSHGHYYGVSIDLGRIREEGIARGADIIAFGHTHKPVVKQKDGVTLINPGSLSYPRQSGRRPTYMIMDLEENGEVSCTIHEL